MVSYRIDGLESDTYPDYEPIFVSYRIDGLETGPYASSETSSVSYRIDGLENGIPPYFLFLPFSIFIYPPSFFFLGGDCFIYSVIKIPTTEPIKVTANTGTNAVLAVRIM